MDQAFIDYIRADSNRYYMLEPEEQELFSRQRDFETRLMMHPASRGMSQPTNPREQLETIKLAKSGQKFAQAKRSRDEIDDLTSKFRRLSVNDQNVMNVVRRHSIFRTDR